MGCMMGKNQKNDVSKKIDEIIQDQRKSKQDIKLLLLGAGESGKSTFAKQIKILYGGGFSDSERGYFKEIIFENIMYTVRGLIQVAEKENIELSKKNKVIADRLLELTTVELDEELGADIKAVYEDKGIKQALLQYRKFHLLDSADYFLPKIEAVVQQDYIPSAEDLLRCRAKTAGIQELSMDINGNKFTIVDVGGQRSERKKWIHCFQDVTAVLFFVALSEYDLYLYEDEDTNRIHESLKLFDEICNSKWFSNVPIILFLNKKDLFQAKIAKVNITVAFPDYKGNQNFEEASEYIQTQFVALNENPEKGVYPHITCATDTANIGLVFDSVKSIVIQAALNRTGF